MGHNGEEKRAYLVGFDGQEEHWLAPDSHGSYLASMQEAVEGLIESFDYLFDGGVVLDEYEEGLFTQRANRAVVATDEMAGAGCLSQVTGQLVGAGEVFTILHGPILAVAYDDEDELRDLTDDEVEEVEAYFTRSACGVGSGYAAEMEIRWAQQRRAHSIMESLYGAAYPIS